MTCESVILKQRQNDNAPSTEQRWHRLGWGFAAVAISSLQLACTESPVFSSAAAISSFSPTDLPFTVTVDADFGEVKPSTEARHLADAVLHSRDHAGLDFIIIDKKNAVLYVFGSKGDLRGASAVLLGAARGDNSVADIGTRPIDQILPEERTTPAGRFIAERGKNTLGEDIIWVDYDAAVSMHRVRATNPKERRLERLATPSADDNRISYGCINIPLTFYDTVLAPTFAMQRAVVYVLPEVKKMEEVFSFRGLLKRS